MSNDWSERRGFSFVELYFKAKVIGSILIFGLAVIIYGEMFRPKDKDRADVAQRA